MSSRIKVKAARAAQRERAMRRNAGADALSPSQGYSPIEAKKPEVLHRKMFMGGRMTPDELHRRLGIRKRCAICAGPAAIRIRIFVPMKEVMQKTPEFLGEIMASNPQGPGAPLPVVQMKYGPALKISDQGFCDNCKVGAERAAAHPPAHWPFKDCQEVQIDRGPGKDKPVVAVAAKLDGSVG